MTDNESLTAEQILRIAPPSPDQTISYVDGIKELFVPALQQLLVKKNTSISAERKRLCAIAITELEGAAMWAVKALTTSE